MTGTKSFHKSGLDDSGYRPTEVCGVVVTFNPGPELFANIAALNGQVGALVIVDNASTDGGDAFLERASTLHSCVVIRNESNLGVAAALNIGIRWAISQGYRWVALFDQDSTVTEGYIETVLDEYKSDGERDQLGLMAPRYKNPTTGTIEATSRMMASDGAPLEIMTSGSMIPVEVFSICGFFREDFFIDQVDHEFSFRLRDFGYRARVCPAAFLLHVPGEPKRHSAIGLLHFQTTHHNALRRYYMTRNSLYMMLRYWRRYPAWAARVCFSLLLIVPAKVLFAEEQKLRKLACISRGVADAFLGKLGKRAELERQLVFISTRPRKRHGTD
jgi:rhamnosyltransferase